MSENRGPAVPDAARYGAMQDAELAQLLREDAETPGGSQLDTDTLYYIMGVLEERNSQMNTGKTAQESYREFREHMNRQTNTNAPASRRCWLRGVSAAAAILALVLVTSLTAQALGLNLRSVLATWTGDSFSFINAGPSQVRQPIPDAEYATLREAMLAGNDDPAILPTWIPEGFVQEEIAVDSTPMRRLYYARYQNNSRELVLQIYSFTSPTSMQIEKSMETVEVLEKDGILYYLFVNNGKARAAWAADSCECYISGDITIDEIKMMIDSIEERYI